MSRIKFDPERQADREFVMRVMQWFNDKEQAITEQQKLTNELSDIKCNECGNRISQKVAEYSKKNYGKYLCMKCQKKHKEDS